MNVNTRFDILARLAYIFCQSRVRRGKMEGMTLQELFAQYGIHRPSDLAHAAGIDRRHAWLIWHGKRRIGHKVALRLYESKAIPIHELLQALAAPHDTPRGRPPA